MPRMDATESMNPAGPLPARTRPLDETPALAERAAALLRTRQAFVTLSQAEARQVAAYMRLVSFPAGTVLFREGEHTSSSYLLLLLEGEVSVDAGPDDAVAIAVLGAGSVIGEMALLDGAPRSASCTTLSTVHAAGLSRRGLEILLDAHPRVAARLMVGLAQRLAERLRAMAQHVQAYAEINAGLNARLAAGA